MIFDAIVLAGGRSRRLGEVAKARLHLDGRTLLQHTVDAVAGAASIVVVGPAPTESLPERVLFAREDPPFGGPAAAVAAGLDALPSPADLVMVLACDMPAVDVAVAALIKSLSRATSPDRAGEGMDAPASPTGTTRTAPPTRPTAPAHGTRTFASATTDAGAPEHPVGVIAEDAAGKLQPLAAIYPFAPLADAVRRHRQAGSLDGLSMFALVREIGLIPAPIPAGATDDVDTWADAERLGVRRPGSA